MNSAAFKTFLCFCLVGVAGLLVDLSVLYAAAPVLGWYLARILSFIAAATATWWLNRNYTFTVKPKPKSKPKFKINLPPIEYKNSILHEYFSYLASMTLGGSVNYATYIAAIYLISLPLAPVIGVALGSCTGLVFNFFMAKHFIFRHKAEHLENLENLEKLKPL